MAFRSSSTAFIKSSLVNWSANNAPLLLLEPDKSKENPQQLRVEIARHHSEADHDNPEQYLNAQRHAAVFLDSFGIAVTLRRFAQADVGLRALLECRSHWGGSHGAAMRASALVIVAAAHFARSRIMASARA